MLAKKASKYLLNEESNGKRIKYKRQNREEGRKKTVCKDFRLFEVILSKR